ncbi:uncharacterized protein DUF222 [Glaciihabitans tibetensis]|uniref:Uncharacterized protein DUF222 n=1 Tax=Glaciihabitans tibetensis TaxID=1266600 RepID=A0A2T0VEM9_9MICO|nr:HNH endonuclease signature motif containing protein [Glaciihabitans tibetensis]PRY68590.1 uncharacterized protein DUF222 [Glaciihabitans tibetensis]
MDFEQQLTAIVSDFARLAKWSADVSSHGLGSQSDEIVLSALKHIEDVGRFVEAMQVHAAAIVEERSDYGGVSDGLAARYGHSRAEHLIEQVTRISQADARGRVRLGKSIRRATSITGEPIPPRNPAVAQAVELGQISGSVAQRIIQGLGQAQKFHVVGADELPGEFDENLSAAEEALVAEAVREPEDLVRVQVSAWASALDPDGAPMRDEDVRARRGLRRGRERNGVTRWEWFTTGETTAMLQEILEESRVAKKPRFLPTDRYNPLEHVGLTLTDPEETAAILSGDTLDGSGDPLEGTDGASIEGVDCEEFGVVTDLKDTRTHEQRDSDVLDGYIRAGIRASANEMGGFKPIVEVTAVATLADLEAGRGVGWIDGLEEPVSIDHIKELACGTGYRLLIQGEAGEVLWMGPKPRLFTEAQKRAVVVRDGPTCSTAGCTKPSRQCNVHHVQFHSEGGPTDVDNAILLCSEHHHMIHKSPFKIEMHNGKPWILAPRWLNPNQSWKPMGHPRRSLPRIRQ